MTSLRQVCVQTSFGTSDLFYSMNCHILYYNWMPNKAIHVIFSVVIHKTSRNSKHDPLIYVNQESLTILLKSWFIIATSSDKINIHLTYPKKRLYAVVLAILLFCLIQRTACVWVTNYAHINRQIMFIFKSKQSVSDRCLEKFCKWFVDDESAALKRCFSAAHCSEETPREATLRRESQTSRSRGSSGDFFQLNDS